MAGGILLLANAICLGSTQQLQPRERINVQERGNPILNGLRGHQGTCSWGQDRGSDGFMFEWGTFILQFWVLP